MHKNHARKSWLLPGMNFRILGKRRKSAILSAPDELEGLEEPRSFFIRRIVPEAGAIMSSVPILVSLTIAASAITQIIASQ